MRQRLQRAIKNDYIVYMNEVSSQIEELLGLQHLPAEQHSDFLAECADDVFAGALLRFEPLLHASEQVALEQLLETNPEPDELIRHMVASHPEFGEIMRAVSEEYQVAFLDRCEHTE